MLQRCYNMHSVRRVASMQDGAVQQANPDVLRESVRNVRKSSSTGKLWMLDNESGLLDGYSLLYGQQTTSSTRAQFIGFHRTMLHSICVFRRRTVSRVRWLADLESPDKLLEASAANTDPLYSRLPHDNDALRLFRRYFRTRLREVIDWVDYCKSVKSVTAGAVCRAD